MKKTKSIIWGIVLIAAGVLWALSSLGMVEVDIFFEGWWTLFIIVPSAISLVTSHDKVSALVGLAVGVVLLLCVRDILEFDMILKLFIPAVIVIVGVKMIISTFADRKTEAAVREMESNSENIDNVFAIFTGEKVDCRGKVFSGAEINAIFGGVDYDLRGAVIEPDSAIKATAVFGGINIFVPENVKVRVKSTAIFGGTSNKARRPDDGAEDVITLYVSAFSMFGGIDIK